MIFYYYSLLHSKLNETLFLLISDFMAHMSNCGLDRCLKLWWMLLVAWQSAGAWVTLRQS